MSLQFSGSPTCTGTIWVSLGMIGRRAAWSADLSRAARSWCRSRSHCEFFRWRIAAVAAADRRWQRGREDESGRIGAHGVDHVSVCRDGAAEAAESLGESAFENVDPVHHALALGDAAAVGPVHPNRMNFVDIGHRTVTFGEIADPMQRGDVAIH